MPEITILKRVFGKRLYRFHLHVEVSGVKQAYVVRERNISQILNSDDEIILLNAWDFMLKLGKKKNSYITSFVGWVEAFACCN